MPTIPDSILHKLRCVRCRKWLSCGPVRLQPNGGSMCGRCQQHNIDGPRDQYRHFAFEALACYFKFPCKNWSNHCPQLLPFKKVLDHEKKCSYDPGCGFCCSHPCIALCSSKRYLNLKAAIKLEVIPDVVLEYLRCTNCAGYLSCAPIYVCRDGTSLCHRCSTQIQPNSEFIRDNAFEAFVDIMIFPCIFRNRGCTQIFKFGEEMMNHELDCPYGKPYVREERASRQIEPLEVKRNDSVQVEPSNKRGVIATHSGHIYATITPNAPLFAPQPMVNKQDQGMFLDEFQRYRDNLANKWGQPVSGQPPSRQYSGSSEGYASDPRQSDYGKNRFGAYGPPTPTDGAPNGSLLGRTDSVYENTQGNPVLIQELKIKQQMRKNPQNGQQANAQHYYGNPNGQNAEFENRYYQNQEPPRKMDYSVYS